VGGGGGWGGGGEEGGGGGGSTVFPLDAIPSGIEGRGKKSLDKRDDPRLARIPIQDLGEDGKDFRGC